MPTSTVWHTTDTEPREGSEATASLNVAWERLQGSGTVPSSQSQRVSMIRALEDLKDAACALQADLEVELLRTEVAAATAAADEAVDAHAPPSVRTAVRQRRTARARRSAIGQVALARRESPHRAGILVGAAEALVDEMPHAFAALRGGAINEHRAVLLVRETACLDREARAEVDRLVCADLESLTGVGTKQLVARARKHAYALDPASIVRRAERCATERNVTLRPAPGSMTYLTALLPLPQGVAVLANLRRAAESARAVGDERSTGQLMADTLVERATGQAAADAVPVAVNLIMSDATLLAAGSEPAALDGAHPVPAQLARDLVARAMETHRRSTGTPESRPAGHADTVEIKDEGLSPPGDTYDAATTRESTGTGDAAGASRDAGRLGAWVRRLYADPNGNLVAMDSHARTFPRGLAALLRVRDQGLCRTPWCDAPVAHVDHVVPVSEGGATTVTNGQGLCAGCNYTKQAPGWVHDVAPDAERHSVTTTTPTGHTVTSTAPAPPRPLAAVAPSEAQAETAPAAEVGSCSCTGGAGQEADSAVEATFRAIIELSFASTVVEAAELLWARHSPDVEEGHGESRAP